MSTFQVGLAKSSIRSSRRKNRNEILNCRVSYLAHHVFIGAFLPPYFQLWQSTWHCNTLYSQQNFNAHIKIIFLLFFFILLLLFCFFHLYHVCYYATQSVKQQHKREWVFLEKTFYFMRMKLSFSSIMSK